MTIEEIRKGAPEGATHYAINRGDLIYLKESYKYSWYRWQGNAWHPFLFSLAIYKTPHIEGFLLPILVVQSPHNHLSPHYLQHQCSHHHHHCLVALAQSPDPIHLPAYKSVLSVL